MFKVLRPLISILVAVVVLFAFVRPMFADIQKKQSESTQYDEAIQEAANFNRLLDSLIARQNSFSAADIDHINAIVPDKIDEVQALVDIKALAEESGLVFGGIDLDLTKESTAETDGKNTDAPVEAARRDINFSVRGNYEEFKSFLVALEQSLVLMEVTHISFEAGEGNIISYSVTVRLYGLPQRGTPDAVIES